MNGKSTMYNSFYYNYCCFAGLSYIYRSLVRTYLEHAKSTNSNGFGESSSVQNEIYKTESNDLILR